MSNRITPTTEATAPEATRPVLAGLRQKIGMVPNIYAAIGHSPGALQSLLAWSAAVATGGLSAREVEQIQLHVAELNGCGYCVSAHSAVGARVGLKPDEIAAARSGLGGNERENALLGLARRIVRTGGARSGTDLARLREAGVPDADVIDVVAVVAIASFTNAVAAVADTEIDFPKAQRLPSV